MSFTTQAQQKPDAKQQLIANIKAELDKQKGVFAVAFKNVATGETLLINEHENFHAASTMKTPVMIELYRQAAAGKFSMTDLVTVKNDFRSIVDSSSYQLSAADDSQQELYQQIGTQKTIYELMYQMIIMSSNLATNILIEKVDGKNVTNTMRELGAMDIQVLRGVEDNKAYAKGLNNTTTAYDLMVIYDRMAKGEIVSGQASQEMIRVLLDQHYRDIIPARLPAGVKVAHKTGFITALHHDSGIVFLPDGTRYVLVLLSKKLEDEKAAVEAMARVSELIFQYVESSK
ncbi:MAG: serine hydrolase [Chitinophagaceae bacterium]|nr:serine hydrolase [Chitinophagaceae bacterium]